MSEADYLMNSVKKEIECYDEVLECVKELSRLVPLIQERKREAEAKYSALSDTPPDVLSEVAPKLLSIQQSEQKNLANFLPMLPKIDFEAIQYSASTGTAAFHHTILVSIDSESEVPAWANRALQPFDLLAQEKAKKNIIFNGLNALNQELGEMFTTADETVTKVKAGVLETDSAAARMRGVIQQTWGRLVGHTKQKCLKALPGQHFELKKPPHRAVVAKCLATTEEHQKFILVLDALYDLHVKLSPVSKDSRVNNVEELRNLYTGWILQLDELIRLLHKPE